MKTKYSNTQYFPKNLVATFQDDIMKGEKMIKLTKELVE